MFQLRFIFKGITCYDSLKITLFLVINFIFLFGEEINADNNVLTAYISESNLQGNIYFKRKTAGDIVVVTAHIKTLQGINAENASWSIRQLPVDYTTLKERCTDTVLGPIRHDLDSMFGRLILNKDVEHSVSTDILSLTGSQGIWQSSIVLETVNGAKACATLVVSETTDVKIGKAKFFGPIFGTVHFFWIGITGSETDAVIIFDIYHVHKHKLVNSSHKWGIFVTDILESTFDKTKLDCNALQIPYNGLNDLSSKIGKLQTGRRVIYRDPTLVLIDLYQAEHNYYVAIYDEVHQDTFLNCATIMFLPETILKSQIESHSNKANITLSQRSPFDPTLVSYNISSTNLQKLGGFRIHHSPYNPDYYKHNESKCFGIKEVYNPTNKGIAADAPFPGKSTQDMYAIGDLSGKLGYSEMISWDNFLPLSGPLSVLHRTLAIYKNTETVEEPWLCGLLMPFADVNSNIKLPMSTAEIIFQYPISGRIIFRQLTNQEYADTVIIVESLLYSDGGVKADTFHHNWTINENPPEKDYYDWQNRCLSAGPVYSPFKFSGEVSYEILNYFNYARLLSALGSITIVAQKFNALELTRNFFLHPNLPISGLHSIIGKSLVIYDENGPKARGNRLACSQILPVNRRKAVIRDWFGNGDRVSIMGDIEMYQLSEYDSVDVEINVEGLQYVNDYHIHMVPVREELQYPCESSSLYDVWNPLNVSDSPTFDLKTSDQFKMGDLSGKYGDWTDLTTAISFHNDSNLQMFGQNSLLGRSLVIHKRNPDRRWACATIERGYAPSEGRELRAIASFHHPLGFVYGYIKMTQLIHNDGSKSDTVIEVDLRHAGKQNQNVTHNHFWLVYVNPVGVDATVEVKHTRCTAAGYVWNPYFIQLAAPIDDDLYYQECGPDQPYRCYAGDLSGRLGTISIGAQRKIFVDPNLPLEGDISAMRKSIVILDKNRGHDKFSCANIEPDKDIIKYANIRKSPRFVVGQFLSDLREILGTPEWMLTVDNRKTKVLHNGACIQLLFHFKGPNANQIELDFSKLVRTGHLASPSIYNPGYNPPATRKKKLNYQLCPSRDTDSKRKNNGNRVWRNNSTNVISLFQFIMFIYSMTTYWIPISL